MFHPLAGADLRLLTRLIADGGRIPPGRWHVPVIALASAVGRLPFTLAEAAVERWLLDTRSLPSPIFVVGYWRSGTTHLTNLLSRHDEFGILPPIGVGLPQEALGLARLVQPFIEQFYPRTRLIDAVPLAPDLPQEDELAIANLSLWSFYHAIYFPKRAGNWLLRGLAFEGAAASDIQHFATMLQRYLGKITVQQGRRPLLVRNPAHSMRIKLLRSIWPDARFIHVKRDPFAVYASAVSMFRTLFRELAIQDDPVDAEELVLNTYPLLIDALARDLSDLSPGNACTVSFEDLEQAPLTTLERIFAELQLDGFRRAEPAFLDYLRGIHGYQKARHDLSVNERARVQARWRPYLNQSADIGSR